ncbi:MAG: permease [Burkholderiales bacterium PBB3]|nr:MAG: permease [Burkholderiales bacterium PBB3]
MLAKLLRNTIFTQVLLGLALGYGFAVWVGLPTWVALGSAALLPFAVMVLVDTYTACISRGAEPWGAWVKSLMGEYWAGFVVFIFRQPWTTRAPSVLPGTGSSKRIPVVLVHGYMCNHRVWDDISEALRAQGHDVFAVNLEPLFTSIDNYAPIVESAVQALLAHSGQAQVALVGHSMGGLAIRAWLRAHGTARVARVLTLGTPHAGTQIPQHMPSPNGRQMAWGSDWLKQLAAQESAATLALFRIAITPQDNIVYPQRAQVLPGLVPRVFEGIGHVQMCIEPDVIQWVQDQLKELPVPAGRA